MDVAELSPTRKRIALLILIVGTGLIVERVIAFGGDGDSAAGTGMVDDLLSQTAAPPRTEPDVSPASPLLRLDRLEARRAGLGEAPPVAPLFAPLSWSPPRPKVAPSPPPPPPPKPVAPAFPYPYIGGLWEDGVRTGFFTRGERVLAVRAGDTVDTAYRIETIDDMQMTLMYLPLEQSLTVVFGAPR